MKKTICLDFDGVIHSYRSGWKGITNIPDPPTIYCGYNLRKMIERGYELVIHSTRCKNWRGRRAIRKWMKEFHLPVLKVVKKKPPAFITVDDRAITFGGIWCETLRDIEAFEVWNKKENK